MAERTQQPAHRPDPAATAGAVRNEVGQRVTGMRSIAYQAPARRVAASLKLEGEDQHCQLRLLIGFPGFVERRALKIVEIDDARPMRRAAEIDDPRRLAA